MSRLKGIYFFESVNDAYAATDRWGVGGKQKYICEVHFSANNITRVDSEWITSFLQFDDVDWMQGYWRGDSLGIAPLTEVLVSGVGVIHDNSFRTNAYKKVMEAWPYSTLLLAAACLGFTQFGLETIAQIVPALVARDGHIEGAHYIGMNELDQNEKRIASLLEEAGRWNKLPPVIRPPDAEAVFHIPDMSRFDFKLAGGEALSLFEHVHANSVHV